MLWVHSSLSAFVCLPPPDAAEEGSGEEKRREAVCLKRRRKGDMNRDITKLISVNSESERTCARQGLKMEWAVSRTPMLIMYSVWEREETSCYPVRGGISFWGRGGRKRRAYIDKSIPLLREIEFSDE